MSINTLQNTPTSISLPLAARQTGWTTDGINAIHEACNAGYIDIIGYAPEPGKTYKVTYFINSITSGYVQPYLGTTGGVQQTTAGFKEDSIVATAGKLRFYANGNVNIKLVAIKDTATDTDPKLQNTIVYDTMNKKWGYFWTYLPERGCSLFNNTYTIKDGRTYIHREGSEERNKFGDVQYQSIIKLVFNDNAAIVKTYVSLSIQSNQLMVTTIDGITTSLGQVSELIDLDFLHDTLVDGATSTNVYSIEGLFSAMLLRDKNVDLLEGDFLKGNYMEVELITNSESILNLFSIQLNSSHSFNGVR